MDVNECLDQLIEALKLCPELERYNEARRELKKYPDREQRLNDFRKKNFQLQNAAGEIDLFTEMDRLADEYRDVYQDEVMQNYLKAEAALCRVVQTINGAVIESLDFEPISGEQEIQ